MHSRGRGAIISAVVLVTAVVACAQDPQWVRDWERAQRDRPATVPSVARIAPEKEPGTPLVIHGRVFRSDGTTPAEGMTVFAYQTDRGGVYNERGSRGWRLRGWAKSDRDGRFEFRTIRPGSYPSSRNPAHVHLTIEGPGLPRRWSFSSPMIRSFRRRERPRRRRNSGRCAKWPYGTGCST